MHTIESDIKRERLYIFDNLKAILIVLVVVGHVIISLTEDDLHPKLQSEFLFIYSFHMPLFLFISGLFQKREQESLNYNKVASLIVLGLTLKMGTMPIDGLLSDDAKVKFSLLDGDGVFWYLFVIAFYNVACYILRHSNTKFVLCFSIALVLLVGYDKTIEDYLCLSRAVVFFPFYYVGFLLTPQKVAEALNKYWIKIVSVVLILVWIYFVAQQLELVYPLRLLFTGRHPYSHVRIEDCSMLHRLIAMSISAVLCIAFISLTPNRKLPVVSNVGTKTLQVYFWHGFVVRVLKYFEVYDNIDRIFPNSSWIVLTVLGVYIALLLSIDGLDRPLKAISKCVKIKV